jgi:segregation and condensation protein A
MTGEFISDPGPSPDVPDTAPLVVDLDGFEGPLDMLLMLARTQKVDLTKISILDLADQFLTFIAEARQLSLDIAADYLVMAAWLAYLKSRMLIPDIDDDEEMSGPDLAAHLTFRLQRLEAMRKTSGQLMERDRLGKDTFRRGAPEGVRAIRHSTFELSLFDLLSGYSNMPRPGSHEPLLIKPLPVYSMKDALNRIIAALGVAGGWERLEKFLPPEIAAGFGLRSAVASTFAASLELTRQGRVQLRQDAAFGPIYMVGARGPEESTKK